jgi:hypothetical protein
LAGGGAKPWVCVFVIRTGRQATARFATKDQAWQFAERHARTFTFTGVPLRWIETAVDASVLLTDVGEYQVTCIDQESTSQAKPAKTRGR